MDDKLFDLLKEIETTDTAKLSKTVPVAEIEDENLREFVKHMYESEDPVTNKAASILNAVICQSRITFLISTRIGSDLVSEDSNSPFKGLNSRSYNTIIYTFLNKTKWFIRLREPTKKQAGVLELIQPVLLEMIERAVGKEYLQAQKKVTLELYDSYEDNDGKPIIKEKIVKPKRFGEVMKEHTIQTISHEELDERAEPVSTTKEEVKEESNGKPKNLFK